MHKMSELWWLRSKHFQDKALETVNHTSSAIQSPDIITMATSFYPGRRKHHKDQNSLQRSGQEWWKSLSRAVCLHCQNKNKNVWNVGAKK